MLGDLVFRQTKRKIDIQEKNLKKFKYFTLPALWGGRKKFALKIAICPETNFLV